MEITVKKGDSERDVFMVAFLKNDHEKSEGGILGDSHGLLRVAFTGNRRQDISCKS